MDIPLWSIATLVSEIGTTACIFVIIWRGYARGIFMPRFALGVAIYECLFTLVYMSSQELRDASGAAVNVYTTALAIFQEFFSVVMLVALALLFFFAWRRYARGENLFSTHEGFAIAFVIGWSLSILSSILLFIELYLL